MKESHVEIDLNVLAANVAAVQGKLRPGASVIFVVKDRAYGHGLEPVVRRAAAAGVDWFAVVHVSEAMAVRAIAPAARILLLGVAERGDAASLIAHGITPVVVSEDQGRSLADGAREAGGRLPVHLKVDTGMGRLGVPWAEAAETCCRLDRDAGLRLEGMCTHFASVEVRKPAMGETQYDRFRAVSDEAQTRLGRKLFRHVSSSRALLYHQEWDLDAVRPGLLLYGYGSGERLMRLVTHPFLEWKSHVVQVKTVPANFPIGYYGTYVTPAPTRIATVAVGYADGYHRALSNRGFVLIGGKRCPVVGRVSMNWITVDVGPDGSAHAGDEAVLIGRQGGAEIWADELAKLAKTIPYEILTSINPLAPRDYRETPRARNRTPAV